MKLVSFAVARKFQLRVSTCNGGFRSDRRFSNFPFHTKTVLENIHINKARGYYTKLSDTKNSDIPGNELDECGLLSLFSARWYFSEFSTVRNSARRAMSLG